MWYYVFFNDTATTEIYTYVHTLSLHDALPISFGDGIIRRFSPLNSFSRPPEKIKVTCGYFSVSAIRICFLPACSSTSPSVIFRSSFRSEEHTSELQSLMRISYAVFCLKKKHKIQRQYI